MNQQSTENDTEKVIDHLNYSNQPDAMAQRLFFDQTKIIRQQKINNEKVIEVLKTIASDNPSESVRKEASRTLTYLGFTPPPINPQLLISINQRSKETRWRDVVIGFFGWVFFHNLYFLIGMGTNVFSSNVGSIVFAILPFLIGLSVVIFTKRVWVGIGSAIAILISTIIWISFGLPVLAFLLPFPVGMGLLMQ